LKRIAVQLPVTRKIEFADFIIEGGGTMEETIRAARNVFDCLSEEAGSGKGVG
jgi:dephospho-CoA kinase